MKPWKLVLAAVVLMAGTAGVTLACSASSPQPVYTCTDYSSCTDGQFLLIKDHLGNPVFAVGQTGGAKTFGDCTSEYNTTDIFNAAVTLCYKPPTGACKAPSSWLSPQHLYFCVAGTWKKKL